MSRLIAALLVTGAHLLAASRLDDALALEAKGRIKESLEAAQSAVRELRASADTRSLARALSVAGRLSLSLGDYRAAIRDTAEAVSVRVKLKDDAGISEDYNTLGVANMSLGNYDEALAQYEKALALDRAHHDAEGEVERYNNIGNVHYFRGRYSDALHYYQQAMDGVTAAGSAKWVPWRRQLTIANLAALYQRLGQEQPALDLYQRLTSVPQALPRDEHAQLLLNEGVLYRRMGDPIKALERYRSAQSLFAAEHHRAGEIGALRNTGIALAIDLGDLAGARIAFTQALDLARQSSDARGLAQAGLYRGEVLWRMNLLPEAETDLTAALENARKTGLVEDQWKANYALGKIAETRGRLDVASDLYRQAIAGIESVRAGLRATSLRSEFLADKRDVYDSLIALTLRQSPRSVETIFSWIERSRARSLQEQSRSAPVPVELSIPAIQARLAPDTVMLDIWVAGGAGATVWITHSAVGVTDADFAAKDFQNILAGFEQAVQDGSERWKDMARLLGARLLSGVPAARHVIVVPDGPLSTLPFELLVSPASGKALVETSDLFYLPAARFLAPAKNEAIRQWRAPWRRQLVAFGDPPVSSTDTLATAVQWRPLPASADEVESIARIVPGRAEIHLGADARKRDLMGHSLQGISLLHFSTHAVVDSENPDRSRILMAPDAPSSPNDYLFQQEVYGLDLKGVDLVTVSACDTAHGKDVRGDGIQAFSRAFLAAGAAATVTSLWRVADRPTSEFMKQFYYFLARGETKSQALRSAKLQFLHSASSWSAPRYWAAFVLNGEGETPCAHVLPWSLIPALAAAILLTVGAIFWTRR